MAAPRVDWPLVRKSTKNRAELELLAALDAILLELPRLLELQAELDCAFASNLAAWDRLLTCQRADLMALLPLTAQRLADLRAAASRARRRGANLVARGAEALRTLGAFAAFNRGSAEELEAEGVPSLAAGKRALADHEAALLSAAGALLAAGGGGGSGGASGGGGSGGGGGLAEQPRLVASGWQQQQKQQQQQEEARPQEQQAPQHQHQHAGQQQSPPNPAAQAEAGQGAATQQRAAALLPPGWGPDPGHAGAERSCGSRGPLKRGRGPGEGAELPEGRRQRPGGASQQDHDHGRRHHQPQQQEQQQQQQQQQQQPPLNQQHTQQQLLPWPAAPDAPGPDASQPLSLGATVSASGDDDPATASLPSQLPLSQLYRQQQERRQQQAPQQQQQQQQRGQALRAAAVSAVPAAGRRDADWWAGAAGGEPAAPGELAPALGGSSVLARPQAAPGSRCHDGGGVPGVGGNSQPLPPDVHAASQ